MIKYIDRYVARCVEACERWPFFAVFVALCLPFILIAGAPAVLTLTLYKIIHRKKWQSEEVVKALKKE